MDAAASTSGTSGQGHGKIEIKNRPVTEIKGSEKGKNLRAKQPNSRIIPKLEESYYEAPVPSVPGTPDFNPLNLYDVLKMDTAGGKKQTDTELENAYQKEHIVNQALIEKIQRQDEELKDKNDRLRKLEEESNAELRRKDEQLKSLDASRKRWHAMACKPGGNSVGGCYYNPGYNRELSENQTVGALNENGETNTSDRENQKCFEGYERRPPALIRSAKYASKKTVHLGVFLEYRKVSKINAVIIHIVICCDEQLMKSTNNTKLFASKPFLVYEDREDPLIEVRSLQWAKNANGQQDEKQVVSLDMLWEGLPFEIKFIREFRTRLIAGDVPDVLKFDVCVLQPRIPETTLKVWCDMREIMQTSVDSKQRKLDNIPALIHHNIVLPQEEPVYSTPSEQIPNRSTLFGVPSLDMPWGENNNVLNMVELRRQLSTDIPAEGAKEEVFQAGLATSLERHCSPPGCLPRRRPVPVCDSAILEKKEPGYENIIRLRARNLDPSLAP